MRRNGEPLAADEGSSGETYTIDKGDKVVLECCYSGSDFTSTVQWKNGDGQSVTGNAGVVLENATLIFCSVEIVNARRYVCVVGGGLAESDPVQLKVLDPEAIVILAGSLTVVADSSVVCASPGGNATLSCTVEGAYDMFAWLFNGVKNVGDSTSLLLTDIQPSNAGTYKCRALGEDDTSAEAFVSLDLDCKFLRTGCVCVCALSSSFVLQVFRRLT